MNHINKVILEAAGNRFLQGDSFKIRHELKSDGSVCTPKHKDPALSITRISNGWIYFCHRCHLSGCINDVNSSPVTTRKRMEALNYVTVNESVKNIELPYDFVELSDFRKEDALFWLSQYRVGADAISKFKIGWSNVYNRLIIPLYEDTELVGWVGRDIQNLNKKERADKKTPKWITRSKTDKRRYFKTKGSNEIVIVEDAISAIVVHQATGLSTIALLNTAVSDDLILELKDRLIYIWLDPDKNKESIKYADRMRQFGVAAKSIRTMKDPKEYSESYLKDLLGDDNNE